MMATALERAGGVHLDAEISGHMSSTISKSYYIEAGGNVDLGTASFLGGPEPLPDEVDDH